MNLTVSPLVHLVQHTCLSEALMPMANTAQLDDTSPQMEWYGNWTSWRPLDRDPWTPQYYRGTFHGTPTEVCHTIPD